MARVKKNVLGNFSGTLGNIYSKIRKGKTIFSSLPESFQKPMDENSIFRRNKFKTAVKMTTEIFLSPILLSIWKEFTPSPMVYRNYLMKLNYKSLDNSNLITEATQLTPFIGTRFELTNITLNDSSIKFDLNLNAFLFKNDYQVTPFLLIHFTSKVNESLEDFAFVLQNGDSLQYSETNLYSFDIPFNDKAYAYNRLYNSKNMLVSVVTQNSEGEIVNFSSSKFISL